MEHMLADIKRSIYEDGEVSEAEVRLLADVLARYGVTEQTVGVLLDLNTIMSGARYPDSFVALFVQTIAGFVMDSGGAVSEDKWRWLQNSLLKDSVIDDLEMALLDHIRNRATSLPPGMAQFTNLNLKAS
ncbi:hypothetical protein WV31_05150 [Magnetospirillum sp. ME-1]|uniref:hypothetical protein n=1 Tax=Magnetospirillum sp. ME-1 TaxID=1639348 RepID=UPI000A17C9CB|nr:hypothetical protein [Magnetospirillum sp. ME-1]ARJ65093.1 hypothetical protein WV31_05150 [Magnetospirillum sp. ME-1]